MILCWRRHGKAGGCRIHYGGVAQLGEHLPCKQGVKSSNLSISTRDCTLQFGNKVSSLTCRHVMKIKHSESLWKQAFNAFETFYFRNVPWKLHIENLIQSSNWKVWNKYQDIRGVTRKCNQTNQNKQLLIVNTINQRMQRYASREEHRTRGANRLVKLIRAQGGCLGTKSRWKTW